MLLNHATKLQNMQILQTLTKNNIHKVRRSH